MGKNVKQRKRRTHLSAQARQNKFTMVAITCVVCMLCGILLFEGNNMQQRIKDNDDKIEAINAQIAEENDRTEEILELEEEMQSEEFIGRKAQETFGFVRDNEIILKPEK